jgi:hypothetical protein
LAADLGGRDHHSGRAGRSGSLAHDLKIQAGRITNVSSIHLPEQKSFGIDITNVEGKQ